VNARKTITLTAYDAAHVYDWVRWYWRAEDERFGGCYECQQLGRRLERLIGPAAVRHISRLVNADRRKHGLGPQRRQGMRRASRQKTDGDGWAWTDRKNRTRRTAGPPKAGEGKAVKKRLARQRRRTRLEPA
jgi:hypothetical protein